MDINQFEHLESKIVALVKFVERQKKEKGELSLKIKALEEKLNSALINKKDITALKNENKKLQSVIERLNEERELIQGKTESLLGQIEKIEMELK